MPERIQFRLPADEKKHLEELTKATGKKSLSETIRELIYAGLREQDTLDRLTALEEKFSSFEKKISSVEKGVVWYGMRSNIAIEEFVKLTAGDADTHKQFVQNVNAEFKKRRRPNDK